MPLVSPITVIGDEAPVAVEPPGEDVTVYPVIADPPVFVGAVKLTVALPLLPVAEILVGTPGAVVANVIDCVVDVSVPAEGAVANVSVYAVPATPLIPTLVKVATPEDAVTVEVPTTVAPALTVIVTCCAELATFVPAASWMCTTGCVVKAEPLAAVAALVVRANCVAVL